MDEGTNHDFLRANTQRQLASETILALTIQARALGEEPTAQSTKEILGITDSIHRISGCLARSLELQNEMDEHALEMIAWIVEQLPASLREHLRSRFQGHAYKPTDEVQEGT